MNNITKVVGALIKNEKNQILICQRPINKPRALLWEFAGGKVQKDESLEEALIRECKEELSIEIKPVSLFAKNKYTYPDMTIELFIYNSIILSGTPLLNEHKDLKWVDITEIQNYEFCPADIDIIKKIKESG